MERAANDLDLCVCKCRRVFQRELHITINTGLIQIPVGSNNRNGCGQRQKEKVERLEILYRQMGRLREPKVLDTRRYFKCLAPHVDCGSVFSTPEYILPGLLTVDDRCAEVDGQWGGLQLLSELKNLSTLRGQFNADIATISGFTLREKDIAWIAVNRP